MIVLLKIQNTLKRVLKMNSVLSQDIKIQKLMVLMKNLNSKLMIVMMKNLMIMITTICQKLLNCLNELIN
jgi:hypothetical protein